MLEEKKILSSTFQGHLGLLQNIQHIQRQMTERNNFHHHESSEFDDTVCTDAAMSNAISNKLHVDSSRQLEAMGRRAELLIFDDMVAIRG